jgi:hypothetical protein
MHTSAMHTRESDEEFHIGLVNMEVCVNCPYLWPAIQDPKRKRRRRGGDEHRRMLICGAVVSPTKQPAKKSRRKRENRT